MQTKIDKKYRKEKILDWELKSLKEKYSVFLFSKKSTWLNFGFILLILLLFAFIIPFIPPRYGWGNWSFPANTNEYKSRFINFLILSSISIFIYFICIGIRNKVDLLLAIKRIGDFKIKQIANLGIVKILIMNNCKIFTIGSRKEYFDSVEKGNIITIKRTVTFKLIDYYIRDENIYIDECARRQIV